MPVSDANRYIDPKRIARAVAAIDAGEIVGLPTETVYGLAADAANDAALLAVYAAKGRPLGHPLIVHIAGVEELASWVEEVPPAAQRLAEQLWPGPLTLVLRKAGHVSDVVTGGHPTVAVRVPAHPVALAVLRALGPGRGLAAPSANRFGRVSPTTAAHVASEFPGRDLLVLDGGPCGVGIESTIVDATRAANSPEAEAVGGIDGELRILRPGVIDAQALANVSGIGVEAAADAGAPAAPGTLAAHYAPLARVTLVAADAGARSIVDAVATDPPARAWVRPGSKLERAARAAGLDVERIPEDPADAARELYAVLRRADELGARHLVVDLPEGGDVGIEAAIRDRLARAATGSS